MPSYILIGLYLKLICFYAYAQSPPGHYERLLNDIFNGYDKRNWTDPRFKWEPSEYGGIQNILVPSEDIWRADVFNYNK
uniref:Neurotransmitter-gated ion-channel ligand-binding domain-containing protein n=1 Tax=Acrobeloides nanus TaxID=290746 RepID=A0A914EKH5_9BILA